jgi:hypothetical protein
MSVTFQCFDAPRKQVPCRFCDEPWADFPEGNGKGGKCDAYCTGFEEVSEAPEVNLSSVNAEGILHLLGWTEREDIWGGSCSGGEMRQRIFRARNVGREHLVEEPFDLPGGHAGVETEVVGNNVVRVQRMGCRVISGGNTDEQTLRRLASLEALAVYAQEHGFEISWG